MAPFCSTSGPMQSANCPRYRHSPRYDSPRAANAPRRRRASCWWIPSSPPRVPPGGRWRQATNCKCAKTLKP
eukprot:363883-Pyramimonas_sp.AAC.1